MLKFSLFEGTKGGKGTVKQDFCQELVSPFPCLFLIVLILGRYQAVEFPVDFNYNAKNVEKLRMTFRIVLFGCILIVKFTRSLFLL
jgi:hypothetical protein